LIFESLCSQKWNDYRLTWNTSEFDGLKWIYLSPTVVWTPDINLINRYEIAAAADYDDINDDNNNNNNNGYWPFQSQTVDSG